MFPLSEMIARQIEYDGLVARLQNVAGSHAVDLAREISKTNPISETHALDAVWDCFCAGYDLEQTRATLMESLRTSVPVRSLIELYVRAQSGSHDN